MSTYPFSKPALTCHQRGRFRGGLNDGDKIGILAEGQASGVGQRQESQGRLPYLRDAN